MKSGPQTRSGFALLELLLILAVLTLVLQLFPSIGKVFLALVDVRRWPRTVWFLANIGIVFIFLGWRFGPALLNDWRQWRARVAIKGVWQEKAKKLKEHRARIEGYRKATKRRLW
jgi:hypothetical protein